MRKTTNKATKEDKIKEIMTQLETGVDEIFSSGKYAEYLKTMSKFHHYSLNNCILIAMQCPEATHVAGYRAWQEKFNRHVKKGETALRIIIPIAHKYTKRVEKEDGSTEDVEAQYIKYTVGSVFNITQTEGEELPSISVDELPETEQESRCKRLYKRICGLSEASVTTEKIDGDCHGYFSPKDNRIVVKKGMTSVQTLKTLVHELAHSKMHGKGCEWEQVDRQTKEMQAESVAYVVCSHLGIDTSEYSFGYIAGWSQGKERKELTSNLEAIKKIASEIIDGVESKAK